MLFPGKIFIAAFVLIAVFGFALGLLHWDKSKDRCLVRRDWSHGSWHTYFAVGRLEFRAKDYGCDPSYRGDPSQWQHGADPSTYPTN